MAVINATLLLVGIVIGLCIERFLVKIDGTFHIDDSDEGKTRWMLQMHSEPEDLLKKKCVKFHVHVDK